MPRPVAIQAIVLLAFALLFSRSASATFPDITGDYTGTVTEVESMCGVGGLSPPNPPAGDSTDTDTLTLSISSQSGSSFSGTGSQSGDPDESIIISFSGTVDSLGNVSGSWNLTEIGPFGKITEAGTFSGTISGGKFSLSASGTTLTADDNIFCNFSISGTLNLVGANLVINPAITPGSTVTNPILFITQLQAITSGLGARIGDVLHKTSGGFRRAGNSYMYSSGSGNNAGNPFNMPFGVWASYSYSDFENDLSSTALDGIRHGMLAGIDTSLWENTVLGLALGFEYSDIDTDFNQGEQETDGFTIVPYFGYLFWESWSLDISGGFSSVESDQFRTLPGTTTIVTSDPDTDRWFVMANLNGYFNFDNWTLGFFTGLLRAESEQKSFFESDGTFNVTTTNKLGQWQVGGEASYLIREYEPYMRFSYQYDYKITEIFVVSGPQPENDRDDFLFSLGVRYFNADGISGNLEWSKRLDREDFDEDTISMTVRIDM